MTKTVTFIQAHPHVTTEGDVYRIPHFPPLYEPTPLTSDSQLIYRGWKGVEPLQQAWGEPVYSVRPRCPRLRDQILDYAPAHSWDYITGFDPAPSTEDPSKLALWPSREAHDQGESKRLRTLNPGKALRRMLPGLTDPVLEELVNWIKENILIDADSFIHKVGTSAADFVHAYTGASVTEAGFQTTPDRKSMNNSCMHYPADEFKDLDGDTHPVEAYASGDFEIHWLETASGSNAARTVVHPASQTRGPLYGTSDASIDHLQSLVGFPQADYHSWTGAKIKRIPYRGGMIAPFFDVGGAGLIDRGTHLELTPWEEGFQTHSPKGLQYPHDADTCDRCGEYYYNDEGTELHNGYYYCLNCAENHTYACECTDQNYNIHADPATEVYNNINAYEIWGPYAVRNHATYIHDLDQYWADAALNANGLPPHLVPEEEEEDAPV